MSIIVKNNFAIHPIVGVPSGLNTADITGLASQVIEDQLNDGAVVLFIQGCTGDVNPIGYKDVHHPRGAEILGNLLGLSTLKALKQISSNEVSPLRIVHETLTLPRQDLSDRIASLEAEQTSQLATLKGTSLNLDTFLPLIVKYRLSPEFPSYASHRYLHEDQVGRDDLKVLDADNRRYMDAYIENVHTMERLTIIQTNLNLLRRHQEKYEAEGTRTIETEIVGIRIGSFVLVTFPGELSVEIGLGIKERSPHSKTFVAGVTNGYIYYTPTEAQLKNRGNAQEDSDCLVSSGWQSLFEARISKVLERL